MVEEIIKKEPVKSTYFSKAISYAAPALLALNLAGCFKPAIHHDQKPTDPATYAEMEQDLDRIKGLYDTLEDLNQNAPESPLETTAKETPKKGYDPNQTFIQAAPKTEEPEKGSNVWGYIVSGLAALAALGGTVYVSVFPPGRKKNQGSN